MSFIVPGCEGNSQEWEEIEWVVFEWDDFDWESVWVDFDLGNIVDWDNIPWDDIIDINILPEDLIEYIISISGAQPFNWGNFVVSESEGCVDNDNTASIGLSIWTDVDGCADALLYLESQGYDCSTLLTLPFVSANPIPLSEICCQTCQNSSSDDCCINPAWIDPFTACFTLWDPVIGCDGFQYSNDCVAQASGVTSWTDQSGFETVIEWDCNNSGVSGCTDMLACNYDITATIDDNSCIYPALNADCNGNCLDGYIDVQGECIAVVEGCMDPFAARLYC